MDQKEQGNCVTEETNQQLLMMWEERKGLVLCKQQPPLYLLSTREEKGLIFLRYRVQEAS
jgi:hypothetical protein